MQLAGRAEQAILWLERALIWCRQANAPLLTVTAEGILGLVEARSGKLAAGLARLRQSVAQIEAMGFRHQLPFCLAALAEATLSDGDHQTAEILAERARSEGANGTATVLALLVLGACSLHHGRKTMARSRIRAALALAEAKRMEPLVGRCHAALAELSGQVRRKRAARPRRGERAMPLGQVE